MSTQIETEDICERCSFDTKGSIHFVGGHHCRERQKNQELKLELKRERECVDWYAQGGHPNMDMWKHETLGYFTGKRARETIAQRKEKIGE